MTLNSVDDELRARVKNHWNEEAIVELIGLIAFKNPSSTSLRGPSACCRSREGEILNNHRLKPVG